MGVDVAAKEPTPSKSKDGHQPQRWGQGRQVHAAQQSSQDGDGSGKGSWGKKKSQSSNMNMVTLEERRHQTDMAQVYKIVHGIDDVSKNSWFKAQQSDRVTRATDPLNFMGTLNRLDVRRNFFSQRVIDHWNNVPHDLKIAKSVSAFKKGYQSLRSARRAY